MSERAAGLFQFIPFMCAGINQEVRHLYNECGCSMGQKHGNQLEHPGNFYAWNQECMNTIMYAVTFQVRTS